MWREQVKEQMCLYSYDYTINLNENEDEIENKITQIWRK